MEPILLNFQLGIKYYDPLQQSVLHQDICRVVDQTKALGREQAKALVEFDSPNQSDVNPTHTIVDFLNAKSRRFKSRVEKLFDFLPIIDQSFVNIDSTEPEKKQGAEQHEVRSGASRQGLDEIRQSPDVTLHTSQSSATCRNADCHDHLSNSARSSIRQSSSDTQSSRSPSLYSEDNDLDSRDPPADTITSPSTSHVARSSTWPTSSSESPSPQDRRSFEATKSVLIGSK